MHINGGVGRRPNPDRSAVRNRVPLSKELRRVVNTPFENGRNRELPPLPRGKGLWHERTLKWWDTIRTMPHARLWSESDWDFAIETAVIYQAFWLGDLKADTSLRIRERLMGCTYESRLSAGIVYAEPEPEPLAEVMPLVVVDTATVAKPKKTTPRSRVRAVDVDGG